jgi:rfaE bifunctional protein kinase chain/domain
MITSDRFLEILDGFHQVRVAVCGDFFLDKYLVIDPALNEPSLETGLDALQVVRIRHSPGAAGTVTSNLAALQVGSIHAVGAIGDDGQGYELRQGLQRTGVDMTHLLVLDEIFTPTYTKPMVIQLDGSEQESHRLDIKNRRPLSEAVQERVLGELQAVLPEVEAVIIADQVEEEGLGVVTPWLRERLAELAAAHEDKIFCADSRANIGEFRQVIIKPNAREAEGILGGATVEAAGQELARRNGRPVYVTLGAEGMLVCTGEGGTRVPAIPVEGPLDIVGAGDSATAGIVAALCAGATFEEAAVFGNIVASITIQQIGTTGTASPAEVLQRYLDAYGTAETEDGRRKTGLGR